MCCLKILMAIFIFFSQFLKVHFRRCGAQRWNPALQTNLFIENNLFTSLQHVFMLHALGQNVDMKYLSNQKEPEASLGYTLVITLAMH